MADVLVVALLVSAGVVVVALLRSCARPGYVHPEYELLWRAFRSGRLPLPFRVAVERWAAGASVTELLDERQEAAA